jgi:hypothetical protein
MSRRTLFVGLVFVLIASACGDDTGTGTPATTEAATTTVAPTTTAAPTTTLAPTTTEPPTTTTTEAAFDYGASFRDDFEDAVDASWEWVNEDPERWTIEDGALVLTAGDRSLTPEFAELGSTNILSRPIPQDVDIAATVSLTVDPDENFEQTGIALMADLDSYVNLVAGFCGPCGIGRGIYLETPDDGGSLQDGLQAVELPQGVTEVRLRIEWSGSDPLRQRAVTLFAFGPDGDWQRIGDIVKGMPPMQTVMLHAGNLPGPESNDEDLVVSFDWFELEVYE